MNLLVVGANGMAGHRVFRHLRHRHKVSGTIRSLDPKTFRTDRAVSEDLVVGVDVRLESQLLAVLDRLEPDVVINCAGIVKQRSSDSIELLEVNSVFPHRLVKLAAERGTRVVHLSTDCVFSGRRGQYSEADLPDPVDLYGVSKLAGEVTAPPALTIRTSIIGLELNRRTSLIEWALAQRDAIEGYTRAVFTGVTTSELARVVERILVDHPDLHGLWHVASEPISKYDLLLSLFQLLGKDNFVVPKDDFFCDRSLDGTAFARTTGYRAPTWDEMLSELAEEIRTRRAV